MNWTEKIQFENIQRVNFTPEIGNASIIKMTPCEKQNFKTGLVFYYKSK